MLSAAGIPLYTEKGRGGGIRLMDDHVLNRTYLTDDEQKEILAALHSFNQVYDPATSSVLNKFSALFPDVYKRQVKNTAGQILLSVPIIML